MVDDLDGVNTNSSAPDYDPGNRYRVKELDPDEAGGGKDFYDGFMRRKKEKKEGEEEGNTLNSDQSSTSEENPIPVVEKEIHDDIILSQRARKILENVNEEDVATANPEAGGHASGKEHINFQA